MVSIPLRLLFSAHYINIFEHLSTYFNVFIRGGVDGFGDIPNLWTPQRPDIFPGNTAPRSVQRTCGMEGTLSSRAVSQPSTLQGDGFPKGEKENVEE